MYQHWSHFQNTIRYLVKTRYWYWKFNVKWWTTVCADINKQVYRVTWRPSETSHCILCWYRLFKRCKSVDQSHKSHMCCTEVNKLSLVVVVVSVWASVSCHFLFCFAQTWPLPPLKPLSLHRKIVKLNLQMNTARSPRCVLRSNQQRRNVHIKSRRTGSYMYY